jgi:hypothetical protein
MQFDSKKDAENHCIAFSRQENFSLVITSSRDRINEDGILVMMCEHHGSYRNTRKIDRSQKNGKKIRSNEDDEVKKPRNTSSNKMGCGYRVRFFRGKHKNQWKITTLVDVHTNHRMATNASVYSVHRKGTEDQNELIMQLIRAGRTDSEIVRIMREIATDHAESEIQADFNPRDISNKRLGFKKVMSEDNDSLRSFINKLESKSYVVRYDTANQRISRFFFTHQICIDRTRQMPDVLVMDATYSTNAHGMPFINIVGVSNLGYTSCTLANFAVAGGWLSSESTADYEWFLYRLRDTIFAPGSLPGPTLMVTDRAQSLINAIKTVFPGTITMLCTVHISRNFSTNVKPTFRNSKKYEEIEDVLKKMYYCQTEAEYNAASKEYAHLVKVNCKDQGKKGMEYLKE